MADALQLTVGRMVKGKKLPGPVGTDRRKGRSGAKQKDISKEDLDLAMFFAPPIEAVAQRFRVSEDTIKRRVHEHFGCTYGELQSERREKLAGNILAHAYHRAIKMNSDSILKILLANFAGVTEKVEVTRKDITIQLLYNLDAPPVHPLVEAKKNARDVTNE